MALHINHPETEELANQLAEITGETATEAVRRSLEDRLERLRRELSGERLADELEAIAIRCAELPILDARDPDEILAYDENGLPR